VYSRPIWTTCLILGNYYFFRFRIFICFYTQIITCPWIALHYWFLQWRHNALCVEGTEVLNFVLYWIPSDAMLWLSRWPTPPRRLFRSEARPYGFCGGGSVTGIVSYSQLLLFPVIIICPWSILIFVYMLL